MKVTVDALEGQSFWTGSQAFNIGMSWEDSQTTAFGNRTLKIKQCSSIMAQADNEHSDLDKMPLGKRI